MNQTRRVIELEHVRMSDLAEVGGKNASLGEMIGQLGAQGVRVPGGFATTAFAFREFLEANALPQRIEGALAGLDVGDVNALAKVGASIRGWVAAAPLPPALLDDLSASYARLCAAMPEVSVAVRSSATAEDLPDASFAGQQDTFLNINGLPNVIQAIREVFASLYNDRAIAYRVHQGFAHAEVALAVAVQRRELDELVQHA